jgi:hypothetical protein
MAGGVYRGADTACAQPVHNWWATGGALLDSR